MIDSHVTQRERIVSATGRLFSDKGYHGTSMADISKAVGLEKGSLYSHIAAKQDVLRELVERGADYFLAAVASAVAAQEPAPQRLRLALRGHLRVVAEHPDLATIFLQEWRRLDGEPRAQIGARRDEYERLWRGIVADGVQDGSLRADVDARFVALLLLSAGNWAYQWFRAQGALTSDEVADHFLDIVLAGILPPQQCDGGNR